MTASSTAACFDATIAERCYPLTQQQAADVAAVMPVTFRSTDGELQE